MFKTPGDTAYRLRPRRRSARPPATGPISSSAVTSPTGRQSSGAGTYWGANVAAGTGEDRYAGWSLVVVYRDPDRAAAQPDRVRRVHRRRPGQPADDHHRRVSGAAGRDRWTHRSAWSPTRATTRLRATPPNWATPCSAPPLSPSNNYFNGTDRRVSASSVAARNPSYAEQPRLRHQDRRRAGASPNGATSATITWTARATATSPGW